MNTLQLRREILAERRAENLAATKAYVAKRFGIPVEEIVDYNSGSAYDKAWVTTRASAEKIAAAVKGETCNGGMFHGMSLGGISPSGEYFEVMC